MKLTPAPSPASPEVEAEALEARALAVQAEQATLLDSLPLESQYSAALASHLDAKHDQAERIEDRLEVLIEMQLSRLQRSQGQQPGSIALPGTRAAWQRQVQQQQSTIQRLQARLEAVREIKDGMALHGPRIEDLAVRKLRAAEPDLTAAWDAHRAEQRREQTEGRKAPEKHEDRGAQRRGASLTLSRQI